jgi:hypothetical protein
VLTNEKKLSGPPKYFTPDWVSAATSVRKLQALQPETAATGHGRPMYGGELDSALTRLADHFEELAVPLQGRYVKEPARMNKEGVEYLPPVSMNPAMIGGLVALGVLATTFFVVKQMRKSNPWLPEIPLFI